MEHRQLRLLTWAEGSPPVTDELYKSIEKEFYALLYLSGLFLNLQPKYRVLSLVQLATAMFNCTLFIGLYGVTFTMLRKDDFSIAAAAAGLMLLNILVMLLFVMYNWHRQELINFLNSWSVGCFDYGDDEEIPEIATEINKSRRQRRFTGICLSAVIGMVGVVFVGGRTIDSYAGITTNSTYKGVYMLSPLPVWCPFDISNDVQHYIIICDQITNVGQIAFFVTVASDFVVMSLQTIVVQLKILLFRIKKADQVAYKLHLRRGGKPLTMTEMYNHHNFRQCYNEYLNKCAAHHTVIIRCFHYLRTTFRWAIYFGILLLTLSIGLALFLLVSGGRPSVLYLGVSLLVAQVIGCAVVCWQAEQILKESALISHELFGTNWILLNKKACRTMMIMTERCKQPLYLDSAVTHTPITWETFGAVLNSSYSYLNLLVAAVKK